MSTVSQTVLRFAKMDFNKNFFHWVCPSLNDLCYPHLFYFFTLMLYVNIFLICISFNELGETSHAVLVFKWNITKNSIKFPELWKSNRIFTIRERITADLKTLWISHLHVHDCNLCLNLLAYPYLRCVRLI